MRGNGSNLPGSQIKMVEEFIGHGSGTVLRSLQISSFILNKRAHPVLELLPWKLDFLCTLFRLYGLIPNALSQRGSLLNLGGPKTKQNAMNVRKGLVVGGGIDKSE